MGPTVVMALEDIPKGADIKDAEGRWFRVSRRNERYIYIRPYDDRDSVWRIPRDSDYAAVQYRVNAEPGITF